MPLRLQLVQVLLGFDCTVTFQSQQLPFRSVQAAAAHVLSIMQTVDGLCAEEILVTIKQVKTVSTI